MCFVTLGGMGVLGELLSWGDASPAKVESGPTVNAQS